MTNKYIITNCPVCYDDIKMCGKTLKLDPYTKESTWKNCQDCTDCLLKQIVEKALSVNGYDPLAKDILLMLEIQECE